MNETTVAEALRHIDEQKATERRAEMERENAKRAKIMERMNDQEKIWFLQTGRVPVCLQADIDQQELDEREEANRRWDEAAKFRTRLRDMIERSTTYERAVDVAIDWSHDEADAGREYALIVVEERQADGSWDTAGTAIEVVDGAIIR